MGSLLNWGDDIASVLASSNSSSCSDYCLRNYSILSLNPFWFFCEPLAIVFQYSRSSWKYDCKRTLSIDPKQWWYLSRLCMRYPLEFFLSWMRWVILSFNACCLLTRSITSSSISSRNFNTSCTLSLAWLTFSCAAPLVRLVTWA